MEITFTPLSPVFLSIGFLKFHYYGLMYVLSFVLGYFILPYIFKLRKLDIKKEAFENIYFYIILGGLIGGRLFFVLFYNLDFYIANPLKIFAIWEGGMASHGGFIGAFISAYIMTKKYKIPFLRFIDSLIIPAGIGLMLGRFGNFINGELYGKITNVSWCINFDNAEGCRHPTQLYAMLKDFILFIIIFNFRKSSWKPGILAILALSIYAIFRFIVEFFKEVLNTDLLLLNLNKGQWFSIILLVLCSILFMIFNKEKKL